MGAGYGVTGIIDPQKLDTYFLTKEVGSSLVHVQTRMRPLPMSDIGASRIG